ncbi:hypothetical protein [Microcoleus vaginatus]|uniref:hypothetical protein n=1 Tax=Microcoleus vaginatus TaxID=119532 RepID=UPI001F61B565
MLAPKGRKFGGIDTPTPLSGMRLLRVRTVYRATAYPKTLAYTGSNSRLGLLCTKMFAAWQY